MSGGESGEREKKRQILNKTLCSPMVFAPGVFLSEGEEIKLSSSSGNSSIFKHAGIFLPPTPGSQAEAPQAEMA